MKWDTWWPKFCYIPLCPPCRRPGFLPSWNCSWKLKPSSNWLAVSSPGFAISSTNSSASLIAFKTSCLLLSQSIPPINISNKIRSDLWSEKTRSNSHTKEYKTGQNVDERSFVRSKQLENYYFNSALPSNPSYFCIQSTYLTWNNRLELPRTSGFVPERSTRSSQPEPQ